MPVGLAISRERLAEFCRRNRIRRLAFFGSVLRDDFGPESDVDVLVEFAPDAVRGLFGIFDMEQQLSALMGGRKVQISTPNWLSKYFRDQVLAEAESAYVET
jgi:predicted nucleotidyltransferase